MVQTVVKEFSFVLVPGYSLLALSCAIDVLRAANQDAGKEVYRWRMLSADNESVMSSSGLAMICDPISYWQQRMTSPVFQQIVALCGGDTSHHYQNTRLHRWLKQLGAQDVMLGSISDGAFIAAQCGLFDHCRSTIHWKCLDSYREQFPHIDSRATILEIEGNRFSCAGGTASLDLFLHFVQQDFGPDAVSNIATNYFHDHLRDSSVKQISANANQYTNKHKVLNEALRLISKLLSQPFHIDEIAQKVGTTRRTLDRLFKRYLDMTPGCYIRTLRLTRASNLLLQTNLAVSEIGNACGFSSASLFGRHFKQAYKLTPLQFRQQAQPQKPFE